MLDHVVLLQQQQQTHKKKKAIPKATAKTIPNTDKILPISYGGEGGLTPFDLRRNENSISSSPPIYRKSNLISFSSMFLNLILSLLHLKDPASTSVSFSE